MVVGSCRYIVDGGLLDSMNVYEERDGLKTKVTVK